MSNNNDKKRVVSRESSTASDVIDLVDDSNGDVVTASALSAKRKSMSNGGRFRGGQSSSGQFLATSSESDGVIDLVNDERDEATKRRQGRTETSQLISSGKRRRSSYDEPTRAKDHAAITYGIVDLLDQLRNVDTLTCAGRVGCPSPSSSHTKLLQQPRYTHQPLHYLQNDNWSCGYRNLQMMISSMLPAVRSIFPDGVPSVHEIQTTMEQLWKEGVDLESAKHHNYTLVGKTGKRAYIGTIEAWAYLSYLGVDAAIVQFLNKNRAMVGDFIWNYFAKMTGPDGCSCFDDVTMVQPGSPPVVVPSLSSFEYGCRLFNTRPVNSGDSSLRSSCTCAMPSLYLQWEGHSITVAGIRKIKSTDGSATPSFNLIVFDPHQRGGKIKTHLETGVARRSSLDTVLTGLESSKLKFELSVNELVKKRENIQLLLSTAAVLKESERVGRKKCQAGIHCITASTTYPLSREYSQGNSSIYR
eukprot:scaffold3870_cov160-Skeletonema_menzelii.AAC.8